MNSLRATRSDSAFAISSSDGNWLATGTDDGTLVVRNAATGQERSGA